jgi:hypothetical protein
MRCVRRSERRIRTSTEVDTKTDAGARRSHSTTGTASHSRANYSHAAESNRTAWNSTDKSDGATGKHRDTASNTVADATRG